ncbi:unnamed protein product [Pleuronectes platessa]|uniref:Uncharacterized protein n=1 Tax=Pleuronectes platessa TaxID=8262 RepID=A0A9N7Z752_PLEPL|nr:unnamed protein product [Pleuronectes platessa]
MSTDHFFFTAGRLQTNCTHLKHGGVACSLRSAAAAGARGPQHALLRPAPPPPAAPVDLSAGCDPPQQVPPVEWSC